MITFIKVTIGIILYIFIGVLTYWGAVLSDYRRSKPSKPLEVWLDEYCDAGFITRDTRDNCYFWFAVFWIVTLPFCIVGYSIYYITKFFSFFIKKMLVAIGVIQNQ